MGATLRPLVLILFVAALQLAAVTAPAGAANPVLRVAYDGGTLTLTLGDGTPVGQTATLAPGVYDIEFDIEGGGPVLQLLGPGVMVTWNEPAEAVFARTLAPDSTYTLSDDNPGSTAIVFRTGDPVPGTTTTSTAPVPGGPPESNTSVVGSGASVVTAALAATVTGSSTPLLTSRGKPVLRVRRGSYRLSLVDRTSRAGLDLGKAGGAFRALTGRSFVGVRTVTVTLTPGRWTLSSSAGKARSFLVTA